MANTLNQNDKKDLTQARMIIEGVLLNRRARQIKYYSNSDPVIKKLNTVLNKIDKLIEEAK